MGRPSRCRRVCGEPAFRCFIPQGGTQEAAVQLTVDEYEVIRLVDYEKKTHEQCAAQMEISRTTVTQMYETARFKLADSIVNGKALRIAGGNYRLCGGAAGRCCSRPCPRAGQALEPNKEEGAKDMKIAVTYENGTIYQHFGHTRQFKLYEIENGAVARTQVADASGSGHGALAGFLSGLGVDALICGGIGGGAVNALEAAGIRLYGGASGDPDAAVQALLAGTLQFDPNARCSDHEHHHGHACGEHACGADKHGCAGSGGC